MITVCTRAHKKPSMSHPSPHGTYVPLTAGPLGAAPPAGSGGCDFQQAGCSLLASDLDISAEASRAFNDAPLMSGSVA